MSALAKKERLPRSPKGDRIEARLPHETKMLIEQAAVLAGMTTSDFMVSRAQEAARHIVAEHERWVLNRQQSEAFVKALLNPPEPVPALVAAARRYKGE
jgi:uncharacterized protein (DUF1778 family)